MLRRIHHLWTKQRCVMGARRCDLLTLSQYALLRMQLRALGFEKYALECIACPDGILDFLKRDLNLHRTVSCTRIGTIDMLMISLASIGHRTQGGFCRRSEGYECSLTNDTRRKGWPGQLHCRKGYEQCSTVELWAETASEYDKRDPEGKALRVFS